MTPSDELVGNEKFTNEKYCFAKAGEIYLVYLPKAGSTELDLTGVAGQFSVGWFDPATGNAVVGAGEATSTVAGGSQVTLDSAISNGQDVLAIVRIR